MAVLNGRISFRQGTISTPGDVLTTGSDVRLKTDLHKPGSLRRIKR
jgi:hypothetical protein